MLNLAKTLSLNPIKIRYCTLKQFLNSSFSITAKTQHLNEIYSEQRHLKYSTRTQLQLQFHRHSKRTITRAAASNSNSSKKLASSISN